MNRGLSILFVALSLIVLAGCSITVEPFEPNATVVSAQMPSGDPSAVGTGTLLPGDVVFFRVNVPASVASASEVIVYDLDVFEDDFQNGSDFASLRVYNTGGSVIASSVSHSGFTSGINAEFSSLGGSDATFRTQALDLNWLCLGPCVISSAPFDRYVRLENISNDTYNFALFAFGEVYADSNETGNNTQSGAPLLGDFDQGAIETIGDVDYFRVDNSGELLFDSLAAPSLELRAFVSGPGGEDVELRPGDEAVLVTTGDIVEVYSSTNWAGSPEASSYSLEIQP